MKYIDLAAAKALIRERGVLGDGYSAAERENDVCDLLDEVPGVELPCKVGDVLYRAFPGLLSTNHVGTIIPVVVKQIVLRKPESEIIAGNRTFYFSEVGKILFKTKNEAKRSLMEGTK